MEASTWDGSLVSRTCSQKKNSASLGGHWWSLPCTLFLAFQIFRGDTFLHFITLRSVYFLKDCSGFKESPKAKGTRRYSLFPISSSLWPLPFFRDKQDFVWHINVVSDQVLGLCLRPLTTGTRLGQLFSNSTVKISANAMIEQWLILENWKCGVTDRTFCLLTVASSDSERTHFWSTKESKTRFWVLWSCPGGSRWEGPATEWLYKLTVVEELVFWESLRN